MKHTTERFTAVRMGAEEIDRLNETVANQQRALDLVHEKLNVAGNGQIKALAELGVARGEIERLNARIKDLECATEVLGLTPDEAKSGRVRTELRGEGLIKAHAEIHRLSRALEETILSVLGKKEEIDRLNCVIVEAQNWNGSQCEAIEKLQEDLAATNLRANANAAMFKGLQDEHEQLIAQRHDELIRMGREVVSAAYQSGVNSVRVLELVAKIELGCAP